MMIVYFSTQKIAMITLYFGDRYAKYFEKNILQNTKYITAK